MDLMTRADIILLAIASYAAIMTLVRLMKRRHDELVEDVQRQVKAHKRARPQHNHDQQGREAA
jgi:hypothetical protein